MTNESDLIKMVDEMMSLSGEDFELIGINDKKTIKGINKKGTNQDNKHVLLYPNTDIQIGNTLIRKLTSDEWVITEIDPNIVEGKVFYLKAFYETMKEREKQKTQSISYTFQNSSNIIAGTQGNATFSINISKIESEIDTKGGKDKKELYALVKEIKELFEKQNSLPKNALARFSETLEKHSWITGSLVQLLGTAAINFLILK